MKTVITLCLTFFINASLFSQMPPYYFRNDVPVIDQNNQNYSIPWGGGINSGQFSSIDVNMDGIKDLFVFDKDGKTYKTFINQGINDSICYKIDQNYSSFFPEGMINFVLLADYNCDGKSDIFTWESSGIAIYKNTSTFTGGLSFEKKTSPVLFSNYGTTYNPIPVMGSDIPALSDIDRDGDLDILVMPLSGNKIEFHKNLSMDLYGNCDGLIFELSDPCWGKFEEDALSNDIYLGVMCKGITFSNSPAAHAGTTLLAGDIDNNGASDLLIGDVSFNNISVLYNGGDSSIAYMDSVYSKYPNQAEQALISFPSMFYQDVNNDQKIDLIVSTNAYNAAENFNSCILYKNLGNNTLHNLSKSTNAFLQEDMLEFGEGCYPLLFDHNGDGLLDILVGNFGYYNPGLFDGQMALLENTGTQDNPIFKLMDRDYGYFSNLNLLGMNPCLGDLDGDGDMDMLVGDYVGKIHYFKNTSTGATAAFTLQQSNYMNIDVGDFAAPVLFDVNGDGLLDLIVGEKKGNINYFLNIGSSTAAQFNTNPTNENFGNIDVSPLCCGGYSTPHLTFNNGEMVMYLGSENGLIYYYNNIEGNLNGTFTLLDSFPTYGHRIDLSLGNFMANGKEEILVGQFSGGLNVLSQTPPLNTHKEEAFKKFHVFPNPSTGKISIQSDDFSNEKSFQLKIFDLRGRLFYTQEHQTNTTTEINLQWLDKGIYLMGLHSKNAETYYKLVLY